MVHFRPIKCPICDGDMTDLKYYGWNSCVNDCFFYAIVHDDLTHYDIFDKSFTISTEKLSAEHESKEILSEIMNEISYWKENDRYLLRVLTHD